MCPTNVRTVSSIPVNIYLNKQDREAKYESDQKRRSTMGIVKDETVKILKSSQVVDPN
jgi:hypothetical protein